MFLNQSINQLDNKMAENSEKCPAQVPSAKQHLKIACFFYNSVFCLYIWLFCLYVHRFLTKGKYI